MTERYITRTISATKVTFACFDRKKGEGFEWERTFGGEVKDFEKLLRSVRREWETEDFKIVYPVKSEVIQQKYRMTETEFIAHAEAVESDNEEEKEGD